MSDDGKGRTTNLNATLARIASPAPSTEMGRKLLLELRTGTPLRHFGSNGSGITAIEYGVIAALIAMVIVAAVGLLGTSLSGIFSSVSSSL